MNNNLEFENEDPSPDSIEDNHPRTNYGEGYYVKETLEEAGENYARKQCDDMYDDIAPSGSSWGWETSTDFIEGAKSDAARDYWYAKWQQERMYSEEEVKTMFNRFTEFISHHDIEEWQNWIDKQFKKK